MHARLALVRSPLRRSLPALVFAALFGAECIAGATPATEAIGRARAAVARGDYTLAKQELTTVGAGPERSEALVARGTIELLTGRHVDAIATAKALDALGADGKDHAAALRGEALAAQGKIAEAITALKLVEADPGAQRARLLLGELLIRSGKRGDATAVLHTLIDDYNNDKIKDTDAEGLAMIGRAAHLLRSANDANDAYKQAEKAGAKKLVEPLLWEADLFLEKYDPGDAGQVVKMALRLAPRDPRVRVAMARVRLENSMDFEGAESDINQALEVNPSMSSAYFVRAGLALRDLDIAAADKACDAGLATNPASLELLSMKAAIRFLADDKPGFEAVKAKVFALNPQYSEFYQVVGEYAEWEHRYEDIVRMMQEATTVDPRDGKAYASLGLNLIRAGDDDGGLAALKKAWQYDKFNVRVYNTLNLFEKDIPTEYVTVAGQPFTIRYQKDEKAILERYVPQMLTEAWGSMVKRYHFTPKVPVKIELYASTENFSVRTSGLPNVGIQGVCFGQTLAAMSPSAAPFNWGNVLWHELGHVFAIQLSKNHVPRWFTEGLSEYETIIRRPEWQREEDPALYAALKAGRIPAVDSFNRAFTHVDDISDVTMAYYAASQILVFMSDQFGFEKVVSMLPKWGAGERTPDVVKGSLGITSAELDARFRAWLKPRLSRYDKQFVPDLHTPPLDDARKAVRADPKNARRYVELALALFADKEAAEGDAMLAEAIRLDPKEPNAHYVLLRHAFGGKNFTEAARLINKMIADGNDGYALRMKAADLAEAQEDKARVKLNLEAAFKLDPSAAEPLQGLYDLAHRQKDPGGELWSLSRLAMLDQHDRRVWAALLEKLVDLGQWEEARRVGEGAMFVAVGSAKVHRLYARALARTGYFISAVYELNSALVCNPEPKEQAEIYADLARAYDKLAQPEFAKKARLYHDQIASAPGAKAPPGEGDKRHRPADDD